MKAIIMAGGKGTRLRGLTNDEIPKPLALVNAKPIIQRQIERLQENGIIDICIVVGYLGEKILTFLGNGSTYGVSINYFTETEPLGTAGALGRLGGFIGGDDFLLIFGDTVFDIDFTRMWKFHKEKQSEATLFIHPNSHPFDSDLVICNNDGKVVKFDRKENLRDYWYNNLVNAGLYILSPGTVANIHGKADLEKDVLTALIEQGGGIYGYRSSEYIKDAGAPDRLRQVGRDLSSGAVYARNLSRKQKAIFLDRDGTLNHDKGSEISVCNFELFPEAAEAVRLVNESGYLSIVVTNQPMLAKGFITFEDLRAIHAKMETILGQSGAYIDAVYYCPHHPHGGFEGEVPELKVDCECRKPKPGMLFKAAGDYNIDLSSSFMIGDGERDMQAGRAAGCNVLKLENGITVLDAVKEVMKI